MEKAYFYEIHPRSSTIEHTTIRDVLTQITELNQFAHNNANKYEYSLLPITIGRNRVYLQRHQGNIFSGAFIQSQIRGIPPSFNSMNESISALNIDEGSGIAKSSVFLLDPSCNLLLYQRGVAVSAFMSFLKNLMIENNFANKPTLIAHHIADPVQIEKLNRFQTISQFELRLVELDHGVNVDDFENEGTQQIIDMARNAQPDTLTLKLTANKKKGHSLNINTITRAVRGFLDSNGAEDIKTLKLEGSEGDEQFEKIDLIENLLAEEYRVIDINEDIRLRDSIHYDTHVNELMRIFERKHRNLKELIIRLRDI